MKKSVLTLVLMAGLPGAGKTTLACALARELRWQLIDKDEYKEALLQRGVDDDTAAREAYEYSFRELQRTLLEQRTSVIFDTAALHHFILDTVIEIMDEAGGVQLKVVLCFADRDLRNYRLRTRPYQTTNIRVDPATSADYFSHFRHLPKDKLILNTVDPLERCLALARDHILR